MATIEIDGKSFDVENGKMIIEVADEAGIAIPRFCYHKKLSVAANCRMCLVEVANSKKTLPACATPITDGMKVFTKSEAAKRSQQAVMEFLLINHPLDCPICDQGGECELQDVSMGYGKDVSEYAEPKRVVHDDDLGSLVATEMTRCIQCTRCVRFGEEIAGMQELGGMGRGEHMQIGTYVEHSLKSEVSANIIDLCPVGALTSKPYRFTARAWEMTQLPSISAHDCLGSNIFSHTRRGKLMRIVPKENETINETWISDRDRFSYLGVNAIEHRAQRPLIKQDGHWKEVDWETALTFAAEGLSRVIEQHGAEQCAALAHPSQTVEELYLMQKLVRALGIKHIDSRLQSTDVRDDANQPLMPTSTIDYQALEKQEQIVLLGCDLLREVPLAGVRIRKAVQNGAELQTINAQAYDLRMPIKTNHIHSPNEWALILSKVLHELVKGNKKSLPESLQKLLIHQKSSKAGAQIAAALKTKDAVLVTGALCENHPEAALLRTLIHWITHLSGCGHLRLTTGANSAGAWLAGALPHRKAGGHEIDSPGLSTQAALASKLKAYLLLGVEPHYDIANPVHARQAMLAAEFVISISAYQGQAIKEYADVILPMGLPYETSGTYININHTWQSFKGVVPPVGEARPAWKILRVLANILNTEGFQFESSNAVLDEVKQLHAGAVEIKSECFYPEALPDLGEVLIRVGQWPLYRVDAMARHSDALQQSASAEPAEIRMHPKLAASYDLTETATVSQGDIEITLPLVCDELIAPDVVVVPNAMPETVDLGQAFAAITIKR